MLLVAYQTATGARKNYIQYKPLRLQLKSPRLLLEIIIACVVPTASQKQPKSEQNRTQKSRPEYPGSKNSGKATCMKDTYGSILWSAKRGP